MSSFAKRVYRVVLGIPPGQVRSYKWVAKKAGSPRAYRAVGNILKHNPYPIIIPCHRVIKSNSKLGGYILGSLAKRKLIDLEGQIKKLVL